MCTETFYWAIERRDQSSGKKIKTLGCVDGGGLRMEQAVSQGGSPVQRWPGYPTAEPQDRP